MAPVVKELQRFPQRFRPVVCVTAQHRELLDEVLQAFQIKVDYDLNIMTTSQTLEEVTVKVLKGIARVCEEARPSVVLVQGDTTTTLAAALAAFYCRIPVGHVEAGLRTYDRGNPYPEEMNRRLTSQLADYHYAPTPAARGNLLREGIPRTRILVTGNTIVDALQWMLKRSRPASGRLRGLRQVDWNRDRIVLVTAHRRESWGRPLERICAALRSLVKLDEGIHVVFPVHPNPAVSGTVHRLLDGVARVHLIPPLSYPAFLWLLNRSDLVITDSGGIQEEAASLGKPLVVTRETTERPEAIQAGLGVLAGTGTKAILDAVRMVLSEPNSAVSRSPFGDGNAARRIVRHLVRLPQGRPSRTLRRAPILRFLQPDSTESGRRTVAQTSNGSGVTMVSAGVDEGIGTIDGRESVLESS